MTRIRQARNLSLRAVILGAGMMVVAVALAAAIGWFYAHRLQPSRTDQATSAPRQAALPLSQSAPQSEYARFDQEKRAVLDGWGWVDRQAAIAHIPIGRAMALMTDGQPETAP